jgi:hypothetical protein
VNPAALFAKMAIKLMITKQEANATYVRLLPGLQYACNTRGRHSVEAVGLIEILAELPAYGARQHNFKKYYVDDPAGWKKLPDDPDMIMYGYWH